MVHCEMDSESRISTVVGNGHVADSSHLLFSFHTRLVHIDTVTG